MKRDEAQPEPMSPRRKGIRRAGKLMFFSAVLFPIFLVMSLVEGHPGPMALPFIVFFISVAWMLYSRLFTDKAAPATLPSPQTQATVFGPAPTRQALPPPINVPIPNIGRHQVRTNELAQPPSVTENTTRLLDDE